MMCVLFNILVVVGMICAIVICIAFAALAVKFLLDELMGE